MMRLTLLLIIYFVSNAFARQTDYCATDDDDPYVYVGTKTPYDFVRGSREEIQPIPNCQPLQIWILARHGTRYPEKQKVIKLLEMTKVRDQIVRAHENRHAGRLCRADLDKLAAWTPHPNMTVDTYRKLTPQGEEDNKLLASRLKSNFPELLQPRKYDITSQNYIFRSTDSSRSVSSVKAFMEGLFGSKYAVPTVSSMEEDVLLKGYKNCTRWRNGEESDPPVLLEHDKFINGEEFTNLVHNVSGRVGFQYDLSPATIFLMYDLCRFEKSWVLEKVSPWCAVFSKDELKILEYSEDLDYFYGAGNGRKANNIIGCFPLQDMFNNFRSLERGDIEGKPKGIFYFTHSMTILTLLTTMNIMPNQIPLTADNYKENIKRRWRSSTLDCFNSNLVAVFYRCKDQESPNKVMFYLQEKPLLYEGCQVGLCDWEYLKNKLGSVASQCSVDACHNENFAVSYQTPKLLITSVILLTLILQ